MIFFKVKGKKKHLEIVTNFLGVLLIQNIIFSDKTRRWKSRKKLIFLFIYLKYFF